MSAVPMGAAGSFLATFAFALAGGLVPFLSIEGYVLAISAASPGTQTLPVVLAASLGQMVAKTVVYLGGRGALQWPARRGGARLRETAARLGGARRGSLALILASALTSVPPFYVVSLAAGTVRVNFGRFFAAGCAGCLLRFAAVFAFPRLFG